MNKLNVIYEDNHIIVVEKPCNVPSQADNTGDEDMITLVKKYIKEKIDQGIDVILEIDIEGARKVNEKRKDAVFIFIMPPSMKILKDRLVARKTETKEQLVERFKTAYKEINEVSKYNYVVVNDDLEDSIDKVNAIITCEKCRVDRIEDVDLGNQEELIHELLIDFNQN